MSSSMSDLNQRIKEQAEPSVFEVIRWAQMVHEDTMAVMERTKADPLALGRFSLDEREEARKIILEYGAGKPARVVEHRGNKKHPILFDTTIGNTTPKQLKEPTMTIDAEVLSEGSSSNT